MGGWRTVGLEREFAMGSGGLWGWRGSLPMESGGL